MTEKFDSLGSSFTYHPAEVEDTPNQTCYNKLVENCADVYRNKLVVGLSKFTKFWKFISWGIIFNPQTVPLSRRVAVPSAVRCCVS